MAISEEPMLDRAMYKQVKGMNREEMEQTFRNMYNIGYDKAKEESGREVDLDALRSDLKLIKGVGETRLNEIMAVIEIHLNRTKFNTGE